MREMCILNFILVPTLYQPRSNFIKYYYAFIFINVPGVVIYVIETHDYVVFIQTLLQKHWLVFSKNAI